MVDIVAIEANDTTRPYVPRIVRITRVRRNKIWYTRRYTRNN